MFGEMVAQIYDEIPDMMKMDIMDIMKMMYDVKYKSENRLPFSSPLQVQTQYRQGGDH